MSTRLIFSLSRRNYKNNILFIYNYVYIPLVRYRDEGENCEKGERMREGIWLGVWCILNKIIAWLHQYASYSNREIKLRFKKIYISRRDDVKIQLIADGLEESN